MSDLEGWVLGPLCAEHTGMPCGGPCLPKVWYGCETGQNEWGDQKGEVYSSDPDEARTCISIVTGHGAEERGTTEGLVPTSQLP